MREIKTAIENILSLIAVSHDYGFHNEVLFEAFANMLNYHITEQDISAFLDKRKDSEGFEDIKQTLVDFKNKYYETNIKRTYCN